MLTRALWTTCLTATRLGLAPLHFFSLFLCMHVCLEIELWTRCMKASCCCQCCETQMLKFLLQRQARINICVIKAVVTNMVHRYSHTLIVVLSSSYFPRNLIHTIQLSASGPTSSELEVRSLQLKSHTTTSRCALSDASDKLSFSSPAPVAGKLVQTRHVRDQRSERAGLAQ